LNDFSTELKDRLRRLARRLIDQRRARVLVRPTQARSGYWFGGGNMIEDSQGKLYLCGRYRNAGDSRTGVEAGERGFELAVFRSDDGGKRFEKILSFSKQDLSYKDRQVLSIERAWLHHHRGGIELYISSEKSGIPYPEGLEEFRKPGTGVWTIDRMEAGSVEALDPAAIQPLLQGEDPRYCHLKDPFVFEDASGNTVLIVCTHPFNWSSANSAFCLRPKNADAYGPLDYNFFPRGFTWDVAITRLTDALKVPKLGLFKDLPEAFLFFYDGGECVRSHTEHNKTVKRPRGYSCEEIGGLAFSTAEQFPRLQRLSINLPLFVSPYGTGGSRYVSTLQTEKGIYALWMQSQKDLSQPLVMNFLSMAEVAKILM
jgi:hypothetical protein